MRRVLVAILLLGAAGCDTLTSDGANAAPGNIPPVQFLRPARDALTGTWVAAWVDPAGFAGGGSDESS